MFIGTFAASMGNYIKLLRNMPTALSLGAVRFAIYNALYIANSIRCKFSGQILNFWTIKCVLNLDTDLIQCVLSGLYQI